MSKKLKNSLKYFLKDVVDNRGRNPQKYFDIEKYPVIDNFLIENRVYPNLKKVKRYIDQNTYDNFLRGYLKKDDVLVTLVGNGICSVSLSPSDNVVIIQNTIGLQTNKLLYNKFLYYYLLVHHKNLIKLDRGSSQPSVNQQDLLNFEIEIPEKIKDQQKIAAVLSALDAKIELNNRINAELEAMAKTLYDYWFVQFDFPNQDGKPYKSSGGKMTYSQTLKREIPEGWEVDILGNHITFERGISYKGTDIQNEGIPMLNLNSFYLDGSYKNEGIKYFAGLINKNKGIHHGDLMIATTDVTRNAYIIGKSFILPDLYKDEIIASCDVAKVNIDTKLDKYFLSMLFNSDNYHRYIRGFASGTLVLHLDTKGIDWYQCPIPPRALLDKYASFKSNIDSKKTLIFKENQIFENFRDWLLPMLMNGQVTVE